MDPTTRQTAIIISKRQQSGSDARNLIAPPPSPPTPPPPATPPKKKNHLLLNRIKIREIQQRRKTDNQEGSNRIKIREIQPHHKTDNGEGDDSSTKVVRRARQCHHSSPKIIVQKPSLKKPLQPCEEPRRKHDSYGKVPSYIRRRKSQMSKEGEKEHVSRKTQPSTSGAVRMPEKERLQTLQLLREKEVFLRAQINRLPVATNISLGAIQKRSKLQQEVKKIQEAKEVFSKSKVYVRQ